MRPISFLAGPLCGLAFAALLVPACGSGTASTGTPEGGIEADAAIDGGTPLLGLKIYAFCRGGGPGVCALAPGESAKITLTVQRGLVVGLSPRVAGLLTVTFDGVPNGVTIDPVQFDDHGMVDQDVDTRVQAAASVPATDVTINVTVSSPDGVKRSAQLGLIVSSTDAALTPVTAGSPSAGAHMHSFFGCGA